MKVSGLIAVLVFAAFVPAVYADEVVMKDGRVIEGDIIKETHDSVVIKKGTIEMKCQFFSQTVDEYVKRA